MIFNWPVTTDTSGGSKFKIAKADFVDYSQAVGLGLDNELQTWTVVFFGTRAQCNEVLEFIRQHGTSGASFQWTPPLSPTRWFRCTGFKPSALGGDKFTLTLDFEPGAEPV